MGMTQNSSGAPLALGNGAAITQSFKHDTSRTKFIDHENVNGSLYTCRINCLTIYSHSAAVQKCHSQP